MCIKIITLLLVIVVVLYFAFNKNIETMADTNKVQETINKTIPQDLYYLDDGNNNMASVHHNICSKACCSTQYPVPFMQNVSSDLCEYNKDNENYAEYVPSQYFCSNVFNESGCLCMTKFQQDHLNRRGGNV